MDKHTFMSLVDKKLITEVDYVDYYVQNPEKLEAMSIEELVQSGIVKEVSASSYVAPKFEEGGEFKLEQDVYLTYPIIIEKDTVIDLNGFNIINDVIFVDESDNSTNCYVFWVKNGKLTVKGEGNVQAIADSAYDLTVWANGGNVDIQGGSYISKGKYNDGSDCVYSSNGSAVKIYGGRFECMNLSRSYAEPQYAILNEKGKANGTIEVFGGEFVKFNPADNVSENPKKNFCAPGYVVEQDGDVFRVVKGEEKEPEIEVESAE